MLVALGSIFDTVFDRVIGHRQDKYRSDLANFHHVQLVLSDAEDGLQGYDISGRLGQLEHYLSGRKVLTIEVPALLPQLDSDVSARSGANETAPSASDDFRDLQAGWDNLVRAGGGNPPTQADVALLMAHRGNFPID